MTTSGVAVRSTLAHREPTPGANWAIAPTLTLCLRRVLELTDGNLGRHLEVLRDQGLVATTKSVAGSRPRTWVSITDAGRAALATEMGALRRLLERFDRHG